MLHTTLPSLTAQSKACFPQRHAIGLPGAMHVVRAQCRFSEWTMNGQPRAPLKGPQRPKLESGPEQAPISMPLCSA